MRRQIILEAPPGKIKERTSECEVPNEYECCYCDSKVSRSYSRVQFLVAHSFSYFALEFLQFISVHNRFMLKYSRNETTHKNLSSSKYQHDTWSHSLVLCASHIAPDPSPTMCPISHYFPPTVSPLGTINWTPTRRAFLGRSPFSLCVCHCMAVPLLTHRFHYEYTFNEALKGPARPQKRAVD